LGKSFTRNKPIRHVVCAYGQLGQASP